MNVMSMPHAIIQLEIMTVNATQDFGVMDSYVAVS